MTSLSRSEECEFWFDVFARLVNMNKLECPIVQVGQNSDHAGIVLQTCCCPVLDQNPVGTHVILYSCSSIEMTCMALLLELLQCAHRAYHGCTSREENLTYMLVTHAVTYD